MGHTFFCLCLLTLLPFPQKRREVCTGEVGRTCRTGEVGHTYGMQEKWNIHVEHTCGTQKKLDIHVGHRRSGTYIRQDKWDVHVGHR